MIASFTPPTQVVIHIVILRHPTGRPNYSCFGTPVLTTAVVFWKLSSLIENIPDPRAVFLFSMALFLPIIPGLDRFLFIARCLLWFQKHLNPCYCFIIGRVGELNLRSMFAVSKYLRIPQISPFCYVFKAGYNGCSSSSVRRERSIHFSGSAIMSALSFSCEFFFSGTSRYVNHTPRLA